MKYFLILFLSISFLAQAQKTVAGVNVPGSYTVGSTKLVLNGAGVRTKYFMSMYVGALFLKAKTTEGATVVSANEAMSVKLHIVSSLISSEKMETAVREGFKKSLNGNTAPMQKTIDEFIGVFKEKINVNDVFDLVYLPEQGTVIFKNGKQVKIIPGLEFKKALYGIWLGSDPADDDLKDEMLGK